MNNQSYQPPEPPSDDQQESVGQNLNDSISKILERVLQTHEIRSLLAVAIPVVLNAWAEKSTWRKITSKAVSGSLAKGFLPSPGTIETSLEDLFKDPDFINHLTELLVKLVSEFTGLATIGAETMEPMSTDSKKKFVSENLQRIAQGTSGHIVTRCARIINEIHEDDPEFFAKNMYPGLRKWIESVDFGEFKEAVDGSAQDLASLVEIANEIMWEYPAKVVLVFSLLPSFMNIFGKSALISATKLDEIPPDLLADIVTSLISEIDCTTISGLLNAISETVRKLHTGSALIGEAGSPQLTKLFLEKLGEIIHGTDPILFWKARIALAETRDTFSEAMDRAIDQNPEHARLSAVNRPQIFNIRQRHINRKLACFESMSDDRFSDVVSTYITGLDIHETTDIANHFLKLLNRLWDQHPEVCKDMISRFSSALDDYELAETVRHFLEDGVEYLQPFARSIIPGVVTWICHVLKPEDDAYEHDAARARSALRALFMEKEV